MANDEHVALLKQGVPAWNAWRSEHANIRPNLSGADLFQGKLSGANLSRADLFKAELSQVNLTMADLSGAGLSRTNLTMADLSGANFRGAHLREADLSGAKLREVDLHGTDLRGTKLSEVDLSGADLSGANLRGANFSRRANLMDANLSGADLIGVTLSGAYLSRADLRRTKLRDADLSEAYLNEALLVQTDLTAADVTGCRIFGISAWRLKLERTKQQSLVITSEDEPAITVDNIEIAQFIYLLLHNEKIRGVIDTVTSKAVLILGRFTDERKAVLDAVREELRKHDYVPILLRLRCSRHAGHYRDRLTAGPHGPLYHRRPHRPEQHPQGAGSYSPRPCCSRSTSARRRVPALCDVQGLLEVRLGASGLPIRGD